MPQVLAFRNARNSVKRFSASTTSVARVLHQPAGGLDCEAMVKMGIESFHWLIRADQAVRRSLYCDGSYDAEVEQRLRSFFRSWLSAANMALTLAAHRSLAGGERVENLDELSNFRDEAQAIVTSFDDLVETTLPEAMARLQDEAIAELRDGKTAEFVEGV